MMSSSQTTKAPVSEAAVVTLLAGVNFSHVVDFVLMMPLGQTLMRVFSISPQQFSVLVSAYTWAAGLSALLGAFFLDRFDRKRSLLVVYLGFAVGTLACGLAPNFEWMIGARIVAGFFGGLVGASVNAIAGDMIPLERRGWAMGRISSAFSLASIFGVPLGLALSQWMSWHAPFFVLTGLVGVILILVIWILPPVRAHLDRGREASSFKAVMEIAKDSNHLRALVFSGALMLAAFPIIPFLSPYLVRNVGFTEGQLPLIYLIGGGFTFFTSQWIGRWSDRRGKSRAFFIVSLLSIPFSLGVTWMPALPIYFALMLTTGFFIFGSGRFVPAMALVVSSTRSETRGAFMSLYACVHNLFAGLAAFLGGMILTISDSGPILHYGWTGVFAVVLTFVSIGLAQRVQMRS